MLGCTHAGFQLGLRMLDMLIHRSSRLKSGQGRSSAAFQLLYNPFEIRSLAAVLLDCAFCVLTLCNNFVYMQPVAGSLDANLHLELQLQCRSPA